MHDWLGFVYALCSNTSHYELVSLIARAPTDRAQILGMDSCEFCEPTRPSLHSYLMSLVAHAPPEVAYMFCFASCMLCVTTWSSPDLRF